MPCFSYQASDKEGKLITGSLEAADEQAVLFELRSRSLFPVQITLQEGKSAASEGKNVAGFSFPENPLTGVSGKDLVYFTQQLSRLIAAGLTIDRSLNILKSVTDRPAMKTVITAIHHDVHGGLSLAEAISKHPKVFSKLYVNMIKAGELGGILERILLRLSDFLEKSQHLKESVTHALIYPAMLFCVGGGAIAFLMGFVIPRFVTIFEDMGTTIPLPTQILMMISAFVQQWWWVACIGFILLVILWLQLLKQPAIRLRWDSAKLHLPLIGSLIQKMEVARFARTLGTLSGSGVPILQALTIVQETVTNAKIATALDPVYTKVKEGHELATPIEQENIFPEMAVQMIKVGEETGQLEEMLLKVADTYENEVENAVKSLIALLEPAMILGMGLLVGTIVVSMLMAIFSINDISF